MTGAALDRDRPRMQLLEWRRIDKGALVGRASVLLPSGLQISDVGVFQKESRSWAQLPAEPMRDAAGGMLKDDRGKIRYRSPLKWSSRELQDGFSAALVAIVEVEHGRL
jgi:hypothetical protein